MADPFSAIGGVVSGIGGIFSQRSANKTNLKINQMNNDFNREEAQKARDFQLEMWNKQNAYNDPSAARARMEAAGYNPYMNPADAGSAQGASSTTAATAASPLDQKPLPFSDISTAVMQLAQASQAMSQKKGQDIDNLNRTDLLQSEIWKNIGSTDWRNASPEARRYNLQMGATAAQLGMKSLQEQWTNQQYSNNLLNAQVGLTMMKAEAQEVLNKYLDQQQNADLNIKAANYEDLVMSGQMKRQEVNNLIAEEILTYARANGQRINNRIARETADEVIRSQNMINRYQGNYNYYMSPFAKRHALEDTKSHTWQTKLTEKMLNKAGFDEKVRGWREALNSANMIIQGIGSGVGSYTDIMDSDWRRSMPRNYEEYEEYDKKRGTKYRNRTYH